VSWRFIRGSITIRVSLFGSLEKAASRRSAVSIQPSPKREGRSRSRPPGGQPRLVRLCHALDHLTELHDDLTHIPSADSGWQPPAGFEAGARALAAWLQATQDPAAAPDPAILKAVADASKQLGAERKTGRATLLEDVALQRTPSATARAALEALVWADGALYHTWRLAESLRMASGNRPTAVVADPHRMP
jgi:hypothetical protein